MSPQRWLLMSLKSKVHRAVYERTMLLDDYYFNNYHLFVSLFRVSTLVAMKLEGNMSGRNKANERINCRQALA